MDCNGLVFLFLFTASDIDDVLILQFDIRHVSFQNADNVDALHLKRAISLHAMHHGMLADGILCQSVGGLNEGLDRTDLSTHLIHARTENTTSHLDHVLVAVQRGINTDGVFVHQLKVVEVELADIEYGVHLSGLTVNADGFCIGIACKTTGIPE